MKFIVRREILFLRKRLYEIAKYHPVFLEVAAWAVFLMGNVSWYKAIRLKRFIWAYGFTGSRMLEKQIQCSIKPYLHGSSSRESSEGIWSRERIGWDRFQTKLESSTAVERTLMLKAPGTNGEKGVIISYFEYNWLRILSGIENFSEFDRRFTMVFSSSWSPGNYEMIGLALEKIPGPIFVQACNYGDREKLEGFHPRVIALDSLPCDWLDPQVYRPVVWEEREIDLLVVSNWAPFKRYWYLFKVLSRLPADLKVVCVGQPEAGHSLEQIRQLQALIGPPQSIQYFQSIPADDVVSLQCNAKVAAIFSRREGCCVAAAEALMADTPLALLENAHVGPKAYINPETGVLLRPGVEHLQLLQLLEDGGKLRPRNWAEANIACTRTRYQTNSTLRRNALERGEVWTRDILQPCWRPYPRLRDEEDYGVLKREADLLTDRYPEVFPKNWMFKAVL